MLRLQLLGTLSIEHAPGQSTHASSVATTDTPAVPLNGAAVQRRPLALLAFLAAAREAGRSREEVLLHLWPDSTPARARNVLKQTLYTLRRDLHAPEIVLTHGHRYRLNPALITSDAAELEAAIARGDVERALALYRGPFLDGFSLGDVPEFDRWAWEERERLAARVEAARSAVVADDSPRQIASSFAPPSVRRRTNARRLARGGLVALVALTSVVALQAGRRVRRAAASRATADETLIAVAPFDLTSADSALAFLGTGMVDLLSVRLTGDRDGDLRAVDPRLTLGAWGGAPSHRGATSTPMTNAAVGLAERLGAGRVVRGSVVGTPARLVLTAEMLAVPTGKTISRASIVGVSDSLSVLVDRLAAILLLDTDPADAGAEPAVRAEIATTPLAGIRDYVEGQASYRAGRYDDAVRHFDRALARDSTFALAALRLAQSAGWAGAPAPAMQRGARLAWRYADRLPRQARLALEASIGGADARRTGYAPGAAVIGAAERAAEANPNDPELWYWLGDRLLHVAPAMGMTAALERASAAFRRAVTLDPTFAPAYVHLVQLTARSGDANAATDLGSQLQARDSTSESAQFVRWRVAVALGDSATLRALRSRFDDMPLGTLRLILATAECDAVGLDDGDRALAAMVQRSATADERAIALLYAHAWALDRGRPDEALRTTAALGDADPFPQWHLRIRVLDALYAGGDTLAARAAVDTLQPFADAPLSPDPRARSAQYDDLSVVTQWRLWHGDRRGLLRALRRLTNTPSQPDALRRQVVNRIAIALLRAIAANTGGSHDVAAVETLDTLVTANVTAPFEWPGLYPSLVAARLFAANGRADRALTAVRRQSYYFPETTYLAASRALEAQLAAQVGDTDIAAAPRRELRKFQGPMRESDGSVIVTRPSAPASPNRPHGDAGSARTAGTTIER
jgi:DNA-binding SARP family transcriptional activator